MGHKGYFFRTKTYNGRLAKTNVFMPQSNLVVIKQRILAKKGDVDRGWFTNHTPIYIFKDYVLMQVELVLWVDSFNAIGEAFKKLNEQWKK